MDGTRIRLLTAVTLALVMTSQVSSQAPRTAVKNEVTCRFYQIGELANQPNVGPWIASTIPQVIQPGSWNSVVCYNEELKVIVVSHTPAVHAQVEEFLRNMRKAVPQGQPTPSTLTMPVVKNQSVVPAGYTQLNRTPEPAQASKPSNYPIPAPLQQPKHLFHLVIRYEGEGAVDAAVSDLVKTLNSEKDKAEEKEKSDKSDKDEPNKSKTEPDKAPQLSQLLHFIIRYEGDGIIDSNVVEMVKAYVKAAGGGETQDRSAAPSYAAPGSPPPPPPYGLVPAAGPQAPLTPAAPRMPGADDPANSPSAPAPLTGPSALPVSPGTTILPQSFAPTQPPALALPPSLPRSSSPSYGPPTGPSTPLPFAPSSSYYRLTPRAIAR
jgi:hypothetical protein